MARFVDFAGELSDDEDFLSFMDMVSRPRRSRNFRDRINQFENYDDEEFKHRFRLSKEVTSWVINEISDEISVDTSRKYALTASEMVLITLRFLATGSFLKVIGDTLGVDESTTSRVVTKVIFALARRRPQFIKMPSTTEERNAVRQGFYRIARFPRCLGAIDCTHVKIISPGGTNAEAYRNRKGFFSYNVQAVCDSNLRILDLVARWPGSAHDSTIFANSYLQQRFQNGEFGDGLLVGDKGYAIKPYLITPLRTVETPAENLFNESLIRTRNTIERCFGVLKRRFPILALGIRLKSEKVQAIIVACAVLHNIACAMNDSLPDVEQEIEHEIAEAITEELITEDIRPAALNNITRRLLITQYFENLT